MSNSFNPFGTKLYYEPENSYLNYFGIKGQNALCITLLKSSDFVTYSYNIGNGCVLHLCSAENKERDKLIPKKMNFFFVALGGAAGACGRYAISHIPVKTQFPVLTLVTNFLGAVLIGFVVGIAENKNVSKNAILFLKTQYIFL